MSINLPCNTFIVAVIALTILKTRNKLCGEFLRGAWLKGAQSTGRAPANLKQVVAFYI